MYNAYIYVLPRQTFSSVLNPWVRTVTAILAQLNPLLAQAAEHPIGLDRADKSISAQGRSALFGITTPRLLQREGRKGRAEVQGVGMREEGRRNGGFGGSRDGACSAVGR